MVRSVDGDTPPAVGTVSQAVCEHCGVRRRRARTFVLDHEHSGERCQVGSGCLREFLGGKDPAGACRHAEQLAAIRAHLAGADPIGRGAERADGQVDVSEWAAHAARVIRAHGWISTRQARDQPSAVQQARQSMALDPGSPTRSDRALAEGALTWARTLLADTNTDTDTDTGSSAFERAAAAAAHGERLDRRGEGLVCALVGVYRQRRARTLHLGTPGDPITISVLVERVTSRPSDRYGQIACCELIDRHVNRLLWWQTRGTALQPGQVVVLAGQVKRHDRRGASAITVLSRCRILHGAAAV